MVFYGILRLASSIRPTLPIPRYTLPTLWKLNHRGVSELSGHDILTRRAGIAGVAQVSKDSTVSLLALRLSKADRPQQDIGLVNIWLHYDREEFHPGDYGLASPDQAKLKEVLSPDLRSKLALPVLADRYVSRALETFPGISLARIVFQPALNRSPHISAYRIIAEKSRDSPQPTLQYTTAWSVEGQVGLIKTRVNIKILSTHDYDVWTQPSTKERLQRIEFGKPKSQKVCHDYPAFQAHNALFKYMLSSAHDDFESLAFKSCFIAYKTIDKDERCEYLRSIQYQVWADDSEHKRDDRHQGVAAFMGTRFKSVGPGLTLDMCRNEYEEIQSAKKKKSQLHSNSNRAYIALGSNIGDRILMIEKACREMNQRSIEVSRTSALYETEPMYVKDQQPFVNGVCEVETSLSPTALLTELKAIEGLLGRAKTIEKGPRNIDLDITLYGDEIVELDNLSIPHKGIRERDFVLRPLCDLIPNARLPSERTKPTFRKLLEHLPESKSRLSPLTPLGPNLPSLLSEVPARPTHLMAILNMTPDSFSDGGEHSADPNTLLPTLQSFLDAGVTILDIGGQSTRPHAIEVTPEEEIARVLPIIKFIRSQDTFSKLAISIDTYRASVAAAAVEAGADIINDVSAGQMDSEMLPTMARLGCTVVLMHMRGTPETMNKQTSYPSGVIDGVGTELRMRLAEAEAAGIRRWRIMLDPGIGFAKNEAQNLELLRRFKELREFEGLKGFPWVVGASRKAFIGKITGVQEASQRAWGTAATVNAAVQGGADVVRVHDVKEMAQVVKMADAIWRV